MLYLNALRRPVLQWGASETEVCARLPGDDLVAEPDTVSTRAITVDAPPEAVWPWLAQLGPAPRGGAYTYDWIENLLGLDMHSVDHVLPEFQDPRPGDEIGLGANRMRLALVEPNRSLAWVSVDRAWLWSFHLRPEGDLTRLISRNAFHLQSVAMRLGVLPMEIGSLVMERKMLLGIRERAERLAREQGARG